MGAASIWQSFVFSARESGNKTQGRTTTNVQNSRSSSRKQNDPLHTFFCNATMAALLATFLLSQPAAGGDVIAASSALIRST